MTDRDLAPNRDLAPIDQEWVKRYCDEFMRVAGRLDDGLLRAAVLRRVECVMDLVDAWQKRHLPMDKR